MPYFHKRAEMSAECKLDKSVPLSYYSSLPIGGQAYHPKTMRNLIQLKTNDYLREKPNASVVDVKQFASDFSMDLYKLYDGSKSDNLNDRAQSFLSTIETELPEAEETAVEGEEEVEAEELAEAVVEEAMPAKSGKSKPIYGYKADGTPDMRIKANREAAKLEKKEAAERLDERATSFLETIGERPSGPAPALDDRDIDEY